MFQLYKQRDFSAYISDTIVFFKVYWKNFFGNYIVITGGILALLCVIYFFVFRDLFTALFNTVNDGVGYDISYYFSDNPVLFISMLMMVIVLSILFSIFAVAYPVVYLKLIEETGRKDFTSSEIFDRIKKFLPRIIRFGLYSLITFFPLIIVATLLASVLVLLVVGVFILILLIPVASVWITQTFYVYMLNEVSFTDAMRQGWKILFSKKFWHIIGSAVVIYFILSILQGMVTMIPYIIMVFSVLATGNGQLNPEFGIYVSILYIVSLVLSYILSNILTVNQGIVYYSTLEQKNHTQALSEIDLIGQNVE
ncbi:hypothetical protein [Proteiniphilum acetatigenes]|uniref:hypothetical protein n=1 Tax=Proteiniphilum acetatigenes TaxID=294710 RepID=UPI00035FC1CA|nr:hypothetical protein [Proteiniphilum acetatigenes]